MQRVFVTCGFVLLTFPFHISAMELYAQNNINRYSDPTVNRDGICHLARLPQEVLNQIAGFLNDYPRQETEEHFFERVQNINKQIAAYVTPYGVIRCTPEGSIVQNKPLEMQNKSNLIKRFFKKKIDYLLRSSHDNFGDQFKENFLSLFWPVPGKTYFEATNLTLSSEGRYAAALYKLKCYFKGNCLDYSGPHVMAIWVINLKTNKQYLIDKKGLPKEELSSMDAFDRKVAQDKGYSLYSYRQYNLFNHLAISRDGGQIALANASAVYITKRMGNGCWEPFEEFTRIVIPESLKICGKFSSDDRLWINPINIVNIAFNLQGTHLAVVWHYEDNKEIKIKIIPTGQNLTKTMAGYLKHKLVCKDLLAQ